MVFPFRKTANPTCPIPEEGSPRESHTQRSPPYVEAVDPAAGICADAKGTPDVDEGRPRDKLMICPLCGSSGVYRHKISQRMTEIARRPPPSVRGTPAARDRARKAVMARWQRVKQGNKPS
jgi:hypothetical protein